MKIGVIVGRFQLDSLHEGHQKLIRNAIIECDRVIVLIGTRIVRCPDNPLPSQMVLQVLELSGLALDIYEIKDRRKNSSWINDLKLKVESLTNPEDDVFFYGSRDSFLSHLSKKENIIEVPEILNVSATKQRESIGYENDVMFRKGYIKSIQDQFPAHFAVVDALITDGVNVLLGHKPSGYCLIGGFADAEDIDLESACIREVFEETGLKVTEPNFIMTAQCRDWRYSKTRQPFTTVFEFKVKNFEGYKANDDIDYIKIIPLTEVNEYFEKDSLHLEIIKKYIDVQKKRNIR